MLARRFDLSHDVLQICGLESAPELTSAESIEGLVHPEDRPRLRQCVRGAYESGFEFDLDFRILRPTGEVRWVNGAAELVRDARGRPIRVLGSLLDVTQRKHMEALLRESERRLRLLHELDEAMRDISEPSQIMPVVLRMLCEHLLASRCFFANFAADGDRAVAPLDYTRGCSSVVGTHRLSAFGPEVMRGVVTGEPYVIRDTHEELPADVLPVLEALEIRATITCGLIRNGALRAVMGVHQTTPRDWTPAEISLVQEVVERCWSTIERCTAEAQLRESEALLQIASHAAHIGGWSLDLRDGQLVWSDEVCRLLEVPVGTSLALDQAIQMFTPESRELVHTAIDACRQAAAAFDFELPLQSAQGRRFWARAIGEAERDSRGTVVRIHGAMQDVDERRRLEEQLRQAQKLDAVGKLAGGIAHDFNNLLTVILSYSAQIAAGFAADDPQRADIEEIRRAGVRASELTQQLLAFSRKQLRQPRVLDLNQVVADMEKMLRRVVGEHIALQLHAADRAVVTFADPGQVEQVIMNLVINARDAMPLGGTLTLETANIEADGTREAPRGRHALLSVSDTGTGMSEATRSHIFEPFFTTKDKSKGTGLGLSTVHGIVAQSAGHISVHSEVGRGTTFQLYFPSPTVAGEPATRETTTQAPSLSGRETVLVVDDDDQVRTIMASLLRRNGYRVLEAQNAGEAFLICEQDPLAIDLLLTDVVMPRMSGHELAQRVLGMRPDLRVLYVSGYTEDAIADHGAIDAELDFLQKPLTPDGLLSKVREILDR
ncbi:MAG TPA: PAS domain-containing protein [Polyangiales bacterium]|nr:PAS domain-containing protein [Polyangiales bacterium]